ncbi:MAG: fused MFS/spermidine synthase [Verrucomicrobiota bacterium]
MKKQHPTTAEFTLSPGLRRYLYVTAGVTGAVILIVEILGAKMLAPYVGTSHFVWTAQIAVTLVALAIGYYWGGWMVDRSPKLSRIYNCILIAGVYLCVTVLLCEPVTYSFLRYKLAVGALLSSAFLFFVPLTLLAAVGPFFIRILTQHVGDVGGQVGRLTAISTLGSVAGVLLIGYALVPFLPNSLTMVSTAGLLFVVVLGYYLVWGRRSRNRTGIVLLALAGLVGGAGGVYKERHHRFTEVTELVRKNSHFGLIQVLETKDKRRFYLNDFLAQNIYDPVNKQSLTLFTYMLHHLARAYTPEIRDVLCIGLGVGIVPGEFVRDGARVDVVEINPAIVPVAQQYFDLQTNGLNIVFGDGRYLLNRPQKSYDTIILDAFLGDSSPVHLFSKEAFEAMRNCLKPNGTIVINCFGDFDPGRDFFIASIRKTIGAVFPQVRIHAIERGNVFVVASANPDLKILRRPDLEKIPASVRGEVAQAMDQIREPSLKRGFLVTDDYNPMEFYDAPNRERFRRQLAVGMQRL